MTGGQRAACVEAEELGVVRSAEVAMMLEVTQAVMAVHDEKRQPEHDSDDPVRQRASKRRMVQALVLQFDGVGVHGGNQDDARCGYEKVAIHGQRRPHPGQHCEHRDLTQEHAFVSGRHPSTGEESDRSLDGRRSHGTGSPIFGG